MAELFNGVKQTLAFYPKISYYQNAFNMEGLAKKAGLFFKN